jgi:hypothetical protein
MIGDTMAEGDYSFSMDNSDAVGDHSVAIGSSISNGFSSVALMGALTTGNYSFGFGEGTIAQAKNQVVVGTHNVAQGNSTSWVSTDDLFIVGNGTADNARSNAFVVKKNGEAQITGLLTAGSIFSGGFYADGAGSLAVGDEAGAYEEFSFAQGHGQTYGAYSSAFGAGVANASYSTAFGVGTAANAEGQFVVGQYNDPQGHSPIQAQDNLFVVGNGSDDSERSNALVVKKSGDTAINGKLMVSGAVRIPPQGDISMGEFTVEP